MNALAAVLFVAAPPTTAPAPEEIQLLEFTAPYCGPCKTIAPRIDQLISEGYPITKVNISKRPELSARYRITMIPTFVLLIDGKERHRYKGTENVGKLRKLMDAAREYVDQRNAKKSAEAPPVVTTPEPARPTLKERIQSLLPGSKPEVPEVPESVRGQEPEKAATPRGKLDTAEKLAMASSVRIRVTYDGKVQFGSGTIIQSREGRTIVLTCAHIMDQAGDDPKVQVDVFLNGRTTTYVGKVIGHHIDSDVGLIAIPTSSRLPTAELVEPERKPERGQKVFSIGCNNGKEPTRETTTLTAVDRYSGPNNLETNKAPAHGRSGGGLFDLNGRVIGVCSAAERKSNRGLYAGNQAIFRMLKKHKLLSVYGGELAEAPPVKDRQTLYDSTEASGGFDTSLPEQIAAVAPATHKTPAQEIGIPDRIHVINRDRAARDVQNLLEEFGGDAEVTVVIRPRDPNRSSRIVVIPHASSNFVAMLQGEVASQPLHTSFVQPLTGPQHDTFGERFTPEVRYQTRPLSVTQTSTARRVPLRRTSRNTPAQASRFTRRR